MRTKISLFIMAGLIAIVSCNGKSKKPPKAEQIKNEGIAKTEQVSDVTTVKKYQIKSGIVTFETTMAGIKGKEILYFDDYGMKELLEKYSDEQLNEATLCDGTSMYKIKYDQKAAYRMGNAIRGVAYKFDWNEIPSADQGTKAKKLANVNIAGKDCESYSYENSGMTTTYAGWNNICLFTEQKMKVGSSVSKAVSIDENAVIAPEKFKIPANFEVK